MCSRGDLMKKFFIVLFGLFVVTQASAMIQPTEEQVQQWRNDYVEHQSKCPENIPLYNNYGDCYSCDDIRSVRMAVGTGDFCSKICSNRKMVAQQKPVGNGRIYCVLSEAPGPDYVFDENTVGWITHNKMEKRSINEVVKNQAHNKMEEIINKVKKNPALNRPYCYTCSEARIKPGANSCPDDKPLYLVETGCMSCEEYDKNWQNFSDIGGCEKCPNIKEEKCKYKKPPYISVNGQLVNLYSERVQSPETTKVLYQHYEQKQSECPSDRPLYEYISQKCYSCDESESVAVGIQELSVYCGKICPNREIKNKKNIVRGLNGTNAVCVLKEAPSDEFMYNDYFGWVKKCPDDKPLYVNKECVSCDYYDRLGSDKPRNNILGCDKCSNIPHTTCFYKYTIDDISLKTIKQKKQQTACPDDTPVQRVGGDCLACDKIDRWTVVQSGCEKCNMKTDGHFCRE